MSEEDSDSNRPIVINTQRGGGCSGCLGFALGAILVAALAIWIVIQAPQIMQQVGNIIVHLFRS